MYFRTIFLASVIYLSSCETDS